jgi:hypothetical protein
MPRADERIGMRETLRVVIAELQGLHDLLREPSDAASGQALGSDDELTPEDVAQVEALVARHRALHRRQRAK